MSVAKRAILSRIVFVQPIFVERRVAFKGRGPEILDTRVCPRAEGGRTRDLEVVLLYEPHALHIELPRQNHLATEAD